MQGILLTKCVLQESIADKVCIAGKIFLNDSFTFVWFIIPASTDIELIYSTLVTILKLQRQGILVPYKLYVIDYMLSITYSCGH